MGSQIKGYTVLGKIAKGGMGEVFKAVHNGLDREVILKKLAAKAPSSFYERFKREATIMMDISHPNIVHMYDYFKETGSAYIAMEYIPGYNLSEIVKKIGKLPVFLAAYIALEIAKGLDYAHQKGVIHRDIKPGNVLISIDGDVKLTDFGIAFKTDDHGPDSMTKTGTVLGTPAYMSPEQIQSSKDVDARSDLYSLGILFYEMLTSKRPYSNEFSVENLRKISKGKHDSIRKYNSNVPDHLITIVKKLMNSDKSKRYNTVSELIEDLNKFIKSSFKDTVRIRTILSSIVNDKYSDEEILELNYPVIGFIRDWTIKLAAVFVSVYILLLFIKITFPDVFFIIFPSDRYSIVNFRDEKGSEVKKYELLLRNDNKIIRVKRRSYIGKIIKRNMIIPSGKYYITIEDNNIVYNKEIILKPYNVKRINSADIKLEMPQPDRIKTLINVSDSENNSKLRNFRVFYRISGNEEQYRILSGAELENNRTYDFYAAASGYNPSYLNNIAVSGWRNNLILNFILTPQTARVAVEQAGIPLTVKINGDSKVFTDIDFTKTDNLKLRTKDKAFFLKPGTYKIEVYDKKHNVRIERDLRIINFNNLTVSFAVENDKLVNLKIENR